MIDVALHRGARDAATRFGIREASVLETLLGAVGATVGGGVFRGALNAAAPRLISSLENAGAAPVNAIRRAIKGPTSPADALVRHLNKAQPASHTLPVMPHVAKGPIP